MSDWLADEEPRCMVLYQTLISLLSAESLCVRGKTGEKKKGRLIYRPRLRGSPSVLFFRLLDL